jgi:peptidoglycan/LPS O-acetylase OafA/YrhL
VVLGLFTLLAGALAGRRPIRSGGEVWSYYRARALRILPPYALSLVLFGVTHLLSWRDVGHGFLLLPALNGHPMRTLWYLNMLVLFYGLAPLLLLLRHRVARLLGGGRKGGLLLALATALPLALGVGFGGERLDPRMLLYFPAFATGLLLSAGLLSGDGDQAWGPLRRRVPLLLLAAAAVVLSLPVSGHKLDSSLRTLPLATLVPVLIVVVASRGLQGRTIPAWLRATSSASYFIYLFHRPLFHWLTAAVAGWPVPHSGWLLLYLLAVGVPLIVWLCWWGQRLYDRSLHSLGL